MDAYERLGLERVAALDEEVLKGAGIEHGRVAHPDQAGGDEELSAAINAAYEVLREPELRLKQLLEVEYSEEAPVWATVPMEGGCCGRSLRMWAKWQRQAREALMKLV